MICALSLSLTSLPRGLSGLSVLSKSRRLACLNNSLFALCSLISCPFSPIHLVLHSLCFLSGFLGGGSTDFGLPSFPVYVFKALGYHLNTVGWVPQVWISQIFIIFYVKVFSNLHCAFKNYYSWNSARSMWFIFPMFGEVFLVTLFWSLWIPWRAPFRSFGATVINTVDQLINNRKLLLIYRSLGSPKITSRCRVWWGLFPGS